MSLLLGVHSLLCRQLRRFAPCRQATPPSPAVNTSTSQASQPFVLPAMCKRGALQAATLVESAFLWVMAKDTGEAATAMGKGWHLHSLSFRSLIVFCVCMPSITCQASPQQLENQMNLLCVEVAMVKLIVRQCRAGRVQSEEEIGRACNIICITLPNTENFPCIRSWPCIPAAILPLESQP